MQIYTEEALVLLAEGVVAGNREKEAELYSLVRIIAGKKFIGFHTCEMEDGINETYLNVLIGLRERRLRNFTCLLGYIARTAVHLSYKPLRDVIAARHNLSLDDTAVRNSVDFLIASSDSAELLEDVCLRKHDLAKDMARLFGHLHLLSLLQRECVYRYYWLKHDEKRIQRELEITGTQYRLAKSRGIGVLRTYMMLANDTESGNIVPWHGNLENRSSSQPEYV